MTVQPSTTTTTSPGLTATQASALLQTLLSSTPSASNTTSRTRPTPNSTPAAPKPTAVKPPRQPQHHQQPLQPHNITIDASTRIMGHCNNIRLSSPSPTEQAARINEMVQAALVGASQGRGAAVNVTVNAGVNLMGSKNVVLLGGSTPKRAEALAQDDGNGGCSSPTRTEGSRVGRKRRAEESVESSDESAGKKVKREEGSTEGMEA